LIENKVAIYKSCENRGKYAICIIGLRVDAPDDDRRLAQKVRVSSYGVGLRISSAYIWQSGTVWNPSESMNQ